MRAPLAKHGQATAGLLDCHPGSIRVIGETSEEEMVATFLRGELTSDRFGAAIRNQLTLMGAPEGLLTQLYLADPAANEARARVLAVTRGFGEARGLMGTSPTLGRWAQ